MQLLVLHCRELHISNGRDAGKLFQTLLLKMQREVHRTGDADSRHRENADSELFVHFPFCISPCPGQGDMFVCGQKASYPIG